MVRQQLNLKLLQEVRGSKFETGFTPLSSHCIQGLTYGLVCCADIGCRIEVLARFRERRIGQLKSSWHLADVKGLGSPHDAHIVPSRHITCEGALSSRHRFKLQSVEMMWT